MDQEAIDGAWHFTRVSLERLDSILDSAWSWLQIERKRRIKGDVEKQLRQWMPNVTGADPAERKEHRKRIRKSVTAGFDIHGNERRIIVSFQSGRKLVVERFSQAIEDNSTANDRPTGFDVQLKCARMSLEIIYSGGLFSSLRVYTYPSNVAGLTGFIAKVRQWAEDASVPRWQQIWRNWVGWHWFVVLVAISLIASIMSSIDKTGSKKQLAHAAHELLKDGISEDERQRADELILALLSNYQPSTPKNLVAERVVMFMLGMLVLSVPFSFAPKTTIGIGAGIKSIRRQVAWATTVKWLGSFLFFGVCASLLATYRYEAAKTK